MTPRHAAVLSLNSTFKNGRFVNLELDSTIKKYGFEDKDKSFYTRLLYGSVERKITLDYIINELSSVEFSKIDPLVKCILETGMYQIFFMDRVPDSAACNEATELVKTLCPKAYAGYVNAVMRNAVRKKGEIVRDIMTKKGLEGTSVRYSIPLWICESFERDYGSAEKIASGFESLKPKLTLKVNTLKISASDFADRLPKDFGANVVGKDVVTLSKSVPVGEISGFEEGLFYVQDESSAACASLVNLQSVKSDDPIIVDTCACPGGKTFSAAVQLENRGRIYSFDLHENRLALIDKGTKRLGITSVITEKNDARTPKEELFEMADAVICDVPCSGLGIIAKKGQTGYRKTPRNTKRDTFFERKVRKKRRIYSIFDLYAQKGGERGSRS